MSSDNQALNFLYLLGCLILVGSGLMMYRMPLGRTLKMVLGWVLIFAAVFVAFALREDFLALGRRAWAEVSGSAAVEVNGTEIRVRRAQNGHFWLDGEVNGQPVRFLVDSGATVTTLTRETAERAGVAPGGGQGVAVETANGTIIVARGRAGRIGIGPIMRSDLPVHISDTAGETNLIGMNFLSTLSAWSVEGQFLVLKS